MEEQTKRLLKECNRGCKMAVDSMDQISAYVEDENLGRVIDNYKTEHEKLEGESAKLLGQYGEQEQEPGAMASTFSWATTEMKMLVKDDSNQIAKIMMNGCNMGIQSISEAMSQNQEASEESQMVAKNLVRMEEDFMGELKSFL